MGLNTYIITVYFQIVIRVERVFFGESRCGRIRRADGSHDRHIRNHILYRIQLTIISPIAKYMDFRCLACVLLSPYTH